MVFHRKFSSLFIWEVFLWYSFFESSLPHHLHHVLLDNIPSFNHNYKLVSQLLKDYFIIT